MTRSKKIEIVNLTPHVVRLITGDGNNTLFPSEGNMRLKEEREEMPPLSYQWIRQPIDMDENEDGVPLSTEIRTSKKRVWIDEGSLPPKKEGTFYIVSLAVATHSKRNDFIVPDELVRDENGNVIGCRSFCRIE
jgi:hypothetical protein